MPSTQAAAGAVLPRGLMKSLFQVVNSIPYAPGEQQLLGGLPRNLPLLGLILRLRYQVNVTGAAFAVLADAPLSLVQKIRVSGSSPKWGDTTLINVSLADLDAYNRISLGIRPFNAGVALGTAIGTYNVDARVYVPFSLLQLRRQEDELLSAIQGLDWSTIDFFATFGSFADLYEGGAGTILGFGGVGNAQITLEAVQTRVGPSLAKFNPFLVTRLQTILPATAIASTGVDVPIVQQLSVGDAYYDLLLKTYVPNPGTPAAETLYDGSVLSRILVKVDSKPVYQASWGATQFQSEQLWRNSVQHQAGYALIDWGQGDQEAAFPTQLFTSLSKQFSLYGDLTATANAQLSYMRTMIVQAKG